MLAQQEESFWKCLHWALTAATWAQEFFLGCGGKVA
jgi:hypothetical protein